MHQHTEISYSKAQDDEKEDEGKVDEEELPFHIYNTSRLLGVQRLVANRPPAKAAAVTVQKVSVQYTRLLTRHPSNSTVDGGLVSKRERERERPTGLISHHVGLLATTAYTWNRGRRTKCKRLLRRHTGRCCK